MKLGQPQVNHPFDPITHHLLEIARQLARQRTRKVLQAHVTYLALKSKVLLFYLDELLVCPQGFRGKQKEFRNCTSVISPTPGA
jgi:hypothetical protein